MVWVGGAAWGAGGCRGWGGEEGRGGDRERERGGKEKRRQNEQTQARWNSWQASLLNQSTKPWSIRYRAKTTMPPNLQPAILNSSGWLAQVILRNGGNGKRFSFLLLFYSLRRGRDVNSLRPKGRLSFASFLDNPRPVLLVLLFRDPHLRFWIRQHPLPV